jgi:hypothetical protein
MNDRPGADPEQPEPAPGRSSYEDFDLEELQAAQQRAPRPPAQRTPTITVAAIVLGVSGLQPLLLLIAFRPGGVTGVGLAVWGVLCIATAALVATLHPIGRPLGIAWGVSASRSASRPRAPPPSTA